MDNNDKSLLRLQIIEWIRSGGKNKVAYERMQTFYNIDPIETRLVLLDTIEYLAREVLENFQTLMMSLYKLSE